MNWQRQRGAAVINLLTIQKFMNVWLTLSLDRFGSESSSNATPYFAIGIKGWPDEAKFADRFALDTDMLIDVADAKCGMTPKTS